MSKLSELFNREGADGVELFRKSLKDNDRNATGDTSRSIAYTVNTTGTKTVLEIRAVGFPSIQNLETGMTGGQVRASDPQFADIERWAIARGFAAESADAIFGSILTVGWNVNLPNRTCVNGGTFGILSNPREEIQRRIRNTAAAAIKLDFLNIIKGEKKDIDFDLEF